MKPSKISYSESKESFDITTGLKSWRKAGVEIELDDADIVENVYGTARRMVIEALGYVAVNPETSTILPSFSSQPLPTIDYSAKEKVEKAIDNAESLVELEGYMSDALQYKIVPQYNAKRKTFIEGKIN